MTIQTTDNKYGVAKWIVDPVLGRGTHTTITAALASASSGDDIFIRPGTYTESFSLKAGVNLTGFECDSAFFAPNVLIVGKVSANITGTCELSGLGFETDGDFVLEITGANSANITLLNCQLNGTDNSLISHANANTRLLIKNCILLLLDTGMNHFSVSAGTLDVFYTQMISAGGSTTPNSASGSSVCNLLSSSFSLTLSTADTNIFTCLHCNFSTGNTTCLTISGTGVQETLFTRLTAGTASAISIDAGSTIEVADCEIQSSNANAITGAGVLEYSNITCIETSDFNVTTQTPFYDQLGKYRATGQPAFLATSGTTNDVTGDGTAYTLGSAAAMTEVYDQDGNFNTNGTFTAPVTGKFQCGGAIALTQIGAAHSDVFVSIVASNRTLIGIEANPLTFANTTGSGSFPFSANVDVDAADTVTWTVTASGSTKTIDINIPTFIYGGILY